MCTPSSFKLHAQINQSQHRVMLFILPSPVVIVINHLHRVDALRSPLFRSIIKSDILAFCFCDMRGSAIIVA